MKISVVSPQFFSYEKAISNEISNQGHFVKLYDDRPVNSNITKLLIRIKLGFLIKKRIRNHRDYIVKSIKEDQPDLLLVINPEVFNADMLLLIKKTHKRFNSILYLWDSINNKSHFEELLPYFDSKFSFDIKDCHRHKNLIHKPLFFESDFSSTNRSEKYDLSFIGTFHSNRALLFQNIETKKDRIFYHLYVQSQLIGYIRAILLLPNLKYSLILLKKFTTKKVSKKIIANILRQSSTVIDFSHPSQTGLTCRTFEALGSGCKLITSNSNIIQYDFYDPRFICVFEDNLKNTKEFISKKLTEDELKELKMKMNKYTLNNWVKELLN